MIVDGNSLAEKKVQATNLVRLSDSDTGSVQVQIIAMTRQILSLAEHVENNKKDQSAKRRLSILVGKRRRFLRYLKSSVSNDEFEKVSQAMNSLKSK